MALLIHESAAEVRFEVSGKLAGATVSELGLVWSQHQSQIFWQKVVVDVSTVSDCDAAGEQLLARILANGAQFSARTPESLDLLRRVSDRAARLERARRTPVSVLTAGAA